MTGAVLSCSHVTKRFVSRGKTTEVLRDVSLAVGPDQIVVIRGRSGTGKSTLLQILAGLDRPTTGRVEIAGRSVEDLTAREVMTMRRQTLGFIFQNLNLIPSWTAGQNVESALIYTRLTRSERRQRVQDMLERLGLGDRIDYLPSELSAGQQQRVAVARALIHAPVLVFADEPTGDVDPETATSIMGSLAGLVRANETALVICTHGELPRESANQYYTLHDGTITPA